MKRGQVESSGSNIVVISEHTMQRGSVSNAVVQRDASQIGSVTSILRKLVYTICISVRINWLICLPRAGSRRTGTTQLGCVSVTRSILHLTLSLSLENSLSADLLFLLINENVDQRRTRASTQRTGGYLEPNMLPQNGIVFAKPELNAQSCFPVIRKFAM